MAEVFAIGLIGGMIGMVALIVARCVKLLE
jgi:hypothetical protein